MLFFLITPPPIDINYNYLKSKALSIKNSPQRLDNRANILIFDDIVQTA